MKRLYLLLVVFVILISCSKSDPENPSPQPEQPKQETISIAGESDTILVLGTTGGTSTVIFTASAAWSASVINTRASDWCSVSPINGKAGTATITITVKENTAPDNRAASVTIKCGNTTSIIKVEQKQKDALTVSQSSFEVPVEGTEIKVVAKSNVSFTHTISTGAQSWIKPVITKALKDSTLTFEIAKNDNIDKRSGEIYLISGNLKDTVKVHQAGEIPSIVISKDEYVLKSEGEAFEVEVASNVNASMNLVFPDGTEPWIAENATRAMSTNKYVFTAQANETYDSRGAMIIFANVENNLSDTVRVIQAQKDAIVVAKSSYNVENSGGTIEIEVSHNIDYEYSISGGWISKVDTKAMATDKLLFAVSENTSYENREGTIVFTANGGTITQEVKIYQSEKRTIIVSKKDYEINADGGEFTIEIQANVEFSVSAPSVDWLHDITTKGLQTHTLKYQVDANETYDSRSAMIIFANVENNLSDTVRVIQAQKDAIVVAKSSYNVENSGGTIEIEVSHNIDYEYSISGDWISKVDTKAMATDKLLFAVSENTSYENREGTIVFTANGGTITQEVKIYQSEKRTIIVSKKDYEINADGGEFTIEIQANVEFSVSAPSVDWLHDITTKGLQTHTLKYQVDANGTYDIRSTQIYIKNLKTGLKDTIVIIQAQRDVVLIENTEYEFEIDGGNLNLEVLTNMEISVTIPSSCSSWIKQVETRSLDSENLFFRVLPCDTLTMDRIGYIYISGGDITREVKVIQRSMLYESSDFSADGIVKELQTATIGNGIDIVLMGDGFSDRLIANGTYDECMTAAMESFFTVEPFKYYRNYFNVFSVKAVSKNERYMEGTSTAFLGYFGVGTHVGGDDDKAFEYAQKAIEAERIDNAILVVVMNSHKNAGTCYMYVDVTGDYGNGVSVSYIPLGPSKTNLEQTLHHEACGHGFAKLGDEYFYHSKGSISSKTVMEHKSMERYGWWKNVDFTDNRYVVKWAHFLEDSRYNYDGLGIFAGGLTYATGVWRPTENSIMNDNTGGFNAPSREAIYYRIHKLAYGAEWEYNYEAFVEYDARNRSTEVQTRSLGLVERSKGNLVPTHPPVVVPYSWRRR